MKMLTKMLAVVIAASAVTTTAWAGKPENGGRQAQGMAITRLAIEKSGVTSDKAIDIAKSTFNGTIYSYELDAKRTKLVYNIKLANPAKKESYQVVIDASDGMVLKESIMRGEDPKSARRFAAVDALKKAGFTVKDAIAKVNPKGELLVTEVDFRGRQGINFLEVEAVNESGRQKMLVDIDTKSVIPGLKVNGGQNDRKHRGRGRAEMRDGEGRGRPLMQCRIPGPQNP